MRQLDLSSGYRIMIWMGNKRRGGGTHHASSLAISVFYLSMLDGLTVDRDRSGLQVCRSSRVYHMYPSLSTTAKSLKLYNACAYVSVLPVTD